MQFWIDKRPNKIYVINSYGILKDFVCINLVQLSLIKIFNFWKYFGRWVSYFFGISAQSKAWLGRSICQFIPLIPTWAAHQTKVNLLPTLGNHYTTAYVINCLRIWPTYHAILHHHSLQIKIYFLINKSLKV